jgi:aminocarboxymuconate-semialdehyde decarboxylase
MPTHSPQQVSTTAGTCPSGQLGRVRLQVTRRASQPTCVVGCALQSPTLAIQEMERCIDQLGLQGVQVGSHIENWNLDAPELFPFFEAAAELGAAILVHPWDMMGAASMPKYWLPWLVGMPAEQSRAACCLIFGGVLERLPKLRVCFAHGGGAFPYTVGRIEHGFRMRPDLVATDNSRNPREYLGRLYFDSCVHDKAALRYLLDVVGSVRWAIRLTIWTSLSR